MLLPICRWRSNACILPSTWCHTGLVHIRFASLLPRQLCCTSKAAASPSIQTTSWLARLPSTHCVEENRFLGLLYDCHLSWVPHLCSIKTSPSQALILLWVLNHVSWRVARAIFLHLYYVLSRRKPDVGCEMYSSSIAASLGILDPVHHAGVRLAIRAFRSFPIPSLVVDADK